MGGSRLVPKCAKKESGDFLGWEGSLGECGVITLSIVSSPLLALAIRVVSRSIHLAIRIANSSIHLVIKVVSRSIHLAIRVANRSIHSVFSWRHFGDVPFTCNMPLLWQEFLP